MSNSSNDKNLKSVYSVKVEDYTHEELMGEATRRAVNPTYFVGWVLDEAVAQGLHKLDSTNWNVFWKSRELRGIKENRDLVRKAAIGYTLDPTDEGAEVLADLCEMVGMNVEEVLDDVDDDRFAAMKASRDSVYVERADWLYKLLVENNGELAVSYIFAKGKELEYSEGQVVYTRKFINKDPGMPRIVSLKHGKNWIWRLEAT